MQWDEMLWISAFLRKLRPGRSFPLQLLWFALHFGYEIQSMNTYPLCWGKRYHPTWYCHSWAELKRSQKICTLGSPSSPQTCGWAEAAICFTPPFPSCGGTKSYPFFHLYKMYRCWVLLETRLQSDSTSRSVQQGDWTLLVCPNVRINLLMFVKSYVNALYHADRSSTVLLTDCFSWQFKIYGKQCLCFQLMFTDVSWLA